MPLAYRLVLMGRRSLVAVMTELFGYGMLRQAHLNTTSQGMVIDFLAYHLAPMDRRL